ncbi:TonB-dependent receptor [Sphingobacterium suaedae]|uniref:TonB-dependent receptor n=1 Tax=Sphingobacterium suaedae TaxID=1686402 RepID=A0ABW5KH30_9SPHI
MKTNVWYSLLFSLLCFYAQAQSLSISGKIVDAQGPLPGVLIKLGQNSPATSTNTNGEFKIQQVKPGTYTLTVSFLGYQTEKRIIALKPNLSLQLDTIRLQSNQHTLGTVEVTVHNTRRATEARALNMQKTSNRIMHVIAADGIGKLPDRNAGEAVQRVPGVLLERDQGEGRFISLRGLPAEWSSSNMNGNRIPTAEEQTTSRSTAFDFFPSELIQFVEVSKAITPDMDGDAMGGTVNFITKTSPDRKVLDLSLGGGYNDYARGEAYSASILYGTRSKDQRFGFIVNGTIWNRDWATHNFEPRFSEKNIARMELRDYFGTRRTLGLNAAADYKLNGNAKIFVRGIYGSLNDNEKHNKLRLRYEKNRAEAQSINNELITRLYGGDIGGEFTLSGRTSMDVQLSHYNNDFNYGDIPNKDFPSYFIVQYDQPNIGYTDLNENKLTAYEVDGGAINASSPQTLLPAHHTVNDNSKYRFSSVQMEVHHINETDRIIAQLNFKTKVSHRFELKYGAKYRNKLRTERYELPTWVWDDKGGTKPVPLYTDLQLVDKPHANSYLRNIGDHYVGIFPKFIKTQDIGGFFMKYRDNLKVDSAGSSLLANGVQTGSNYDVYEQHTAAYMMGSLSLSDQLSLVGGLRAEHTNLQVDGWLYEAQEGQPNYKGTLTPQSKKNDYIVLLPMFHLKYTPATNLNLRLAATKTFARPDFGSLVAGGSYKVQDNTFSYGNPNLIPITAYNFDLMSEYFFSNVGMISAGAFYKLIKDPIFQGSSFYETFEGKDNVRVLQDQNGDDAHVVGFELAFQKKFDFLPGLLSGFGIHTNYTFIRSKMQILHRDDHTRIPRQANNLFNIGLFYEKGKVQTRLAVNHKGVNMVAFGTDASGDEYFDKNTTMDANLTYRIHRKILLFAEANNLLNTRFKYFLGVPERPTQVEYYGVRGQVGIKLSL